MVVEYKCPSCGAPLTFDSSVQNMLCDFCDTQIDVAELQKQQKTPSSDSAEACHQESHKDAFGTSDADFTHYRCQNCGAELLTDEHTAATFCNYCGSPALLKDRISGVQTPAQLIPFQINKETAAETYQKWCKKGPLTPKSFLQRSTIEKISGIYVPFWLFDYHADTTVNANCTRIRHERRGDTEYTHTDHYRVHRDISNDYLKIPADASIKMPNHMMDCLEPYHYNDLCAFDLPYLSGYLSEKYSETSSQVAPRIETRVKQYIKEDAYSTMQKYDTRQIVNERTSLQCKAAKYTMLPVWMLNCHYNGNDYLVAINGQTGKLVGDRPVAKERCMFWWALWTLTAALICFLIGTTGALNGTGIERLFQNPLYYGILSVIIGILAVVLMASQNRSHMTANSSTYAKNGAFHINKQRDVFTHTTTVTHQLHREEPKENKK